MKNLLTIVFVLFLAGSLAAQGVVLIDNFDSSAVNNRYYRVSEGDPTTIDFADNHSDFHEGTGSFDFKAVLGAFHDWGTFAEMQDRPPAGEYFDWSYSDSLSIWVKVYQAATQPANMVFRMQFRDQPTPSDPVEQYVYEHPALLDATSGWYNLRISLRQIESDGSINPGDSGFVITPSSWGMPKNNEILDYDKIISFGIVAVTTANYVDSVKVGFDELTLFGFKSVPAIIFNGIVIPSRLSSWSWGQSTLGVEEGAGPVSGTNALKWVQGNEWSNGWTGIGFTVDPPFNLGSSWQIDSVKFKMKTDPGVGALRIQFESGAAKVGKVFQPVADEQWHDYALALRDMVPQDNTSGFDSTNVTVVGMMAEASGIAGKVLYITDWWTGNPSFDIIPPLAPQNVSAFAGTQLNIVQWDDVPGETGEKYDVYYSLNQITDLTASGVEVVKLGIDENTQLVNHLLFSPVTSQNVTYYYAIVCKDASGNASVLSANSAPLTNEAKGVTTISLTPPATFTADGDLSEWQSITPFRMFPSDGTGNIVTNTTISGDADLSVLAYVAVDNTYLYVAFDVEDDIVSFNPAIQSYLNDAPDIYLGLYNWHGTPHGSYQGGANPDYHFRFAQDRIIEDHLGADADSLILPGSEYSWTPTFPTGYAVEARIPWTLIAGINDDSLFVPVEGFRIPIDFAINDADGTGEREGILTYSPFNEDFSWRDVNRWLYTWIGSLWNPVGVEDDEMTVDEYTLSQNYPNPFNPSTQINYTLKNSGHVTLKVFDVLGRTVATLVNQDQNAGIHTVQFDASNFSSGIYFYRLESGSFVQTNKMMLLK